MTNHDKPSNLEALYFERNSPMQKFTTKLPKLYYYFFLNMHQKVKTGATVWLALPIFFWQHTPEMGESQVNPSNYWIFSQELISKWWGFPYVNLLQGISHYILYYIYYNTYVYIYISPYSYSMNPLFCMVITLW